MKNSKNDYLFNEVNENKNRVIRVMLMIIGIISLVLGIIGIFLPLLPTTPFLLLSAACFAKSSKKFYKWLLENKYFGEYIRNYKEKRGIPIKVKIYSCSLLWATILFSVIFVIDSIIIKFVLVIIALIVSYHILSLKTLK